MTNESKKEGTQPEKWEEELSRLFDHEDVDYHSLKDFIRRVRSQALAEGGCCFSKKGGFCPEHGLVAAPRRECCGECIFHHSFSKHCRDTNCPCHTPKEEKECKHGKLGIADCYWCRSDIHPPIEPIEELNIPMPASDNYTMPDLIEMMGRKINEIVRLLNTLNRDKIS